MAKLSDTLNITVYCSSSNRRRAPVYVGSGIAMLLAACVSLDSRVEQALLDELPRLIGPAAQYEVDVDEAEITASEGEFKRVHATGKRVRRPKSPVLDHVEVDLYDVSIDRQAKTLTRLGNADATVKVLAADVERFLEQRASLESVSLRFNAPDNVLVTARPVIAGFSLPSAAIVEMSGQLLPEGAELRLEIADVRIAGLSGGILSKNILERAINPLVDLSALAVPAKISGAHIEGNALIIKATGSRFAP